MVEPLIRLIKFTPKGYTLTSNNLSLSSKWYADDAKLVAPTIPALEAQLQVVEAFSKWSDICLNIPRCRLTGYLHKLHNIKTTKNRDTAVQTRLAHARIGGTPIPVLSQDDPLPGGYLGTALTASLCPKARLKWTLEVLATISKTVLTTPLPPNIKQRLLLYGANSKIMHTHCLMALSPTAITSIDSLLEAACRKIWRLPKGFPRAGLHAPHDELGLSLLTIWEDYCAAAPNSWTNILNDQGALGATARASLTQAATKFQH
jgi:hypothetical protein